MDRSQAEQLRDRMSSEHPDRATHSFLLSERNGEWTVAKVALPPGSAPRGAPASPRPQPVHDHAGGMLPGGVHPWSAPGG